MRPLPVAVLLALLAAGCSSPGSASASGSSIRFNATSVRPDQTIVENAAASPNLSTFVSTLRAAELAGALNAEGPFTVFVPDDAAFEAVDAGAFQDLLRPENQGRLRALLEGHVVEGVYTGVELRAGATLTTLSGRSLRVEASGEGLEVGGAATVTLADVAATNGVAHVIDAVLMP